MPSTPQLISCTGVSIVRVNAIIKNCEQQLCSNYSAYTQRVSINWEPNDKNQAINKHQSPNQLIGALSCILYLLIRTCTQAIRRILYWYGCICLCRLCQGCCSSAILSCSLRMLSRSMQCPSPSFLST